MESHETPPEQIVLDVDTTDLALHGKQEGRFFHGYYDNYCYLPLYIFCGEHLLCARLREANHDAAVGSLAEIRAHRGADSRAVGRVKIILRGDSGFCRNELMNWAEQQEGVDYVFGLARNDRLRRMIAPQLAEAAAGHARTGKPARVFTEFPHTTTTGSWNRARRVVAKAEQIDGKENPRFVVTRWAGEWPARLFEDVLRARRYGEPHQRAVQLFAGGSAKPCAPTRCGCTCRRWRTCW